MPKQPSKPPGYRSSALDEKRRFLTPPRYQIGTGYFFRCVQDVHESGRCGRTGRSGTQRTVVGIGWGPKGRWFKSSRPD